MKRYVVLSFIVGLALPPLLCGVGALTFFMLCSTVFTGLDDLVYAILGSGGVMLLLCPLAGWKLTAGRTLPATLAERYIPALLLPPLVYLIVVSIYFSMLDRVSLYLGLTYTMYAAIPWLLFALGVFWGARKNAPVRETGKGMLQMAGYTMLACLVIGANLYGLIHNTLLDPTGNEGQKIYLPEYLPSVQSKRLARPANPPSLRITKNYPRMNGEADMLPLYGAIAQAVYDIGNAEDVANQASENGNDGGQEARKAALSAVGYHWTIRMPIRLLACRDYDLVFGDLAAAQEASDREAKEWGKVLELTPIAYDALVFFVHEDNPVTDLSLAQVRDIYAGVLRSWNDVGGPDARIFAFQTDDSRTQQAMETRVMQGRAMLRPLTDEFGHVAEYRNRPDALGYTFLWRAARMFPKGDIRLLTIDGIAPTPENIRSGRYPLASPIVMASRPSPGKEVAALMEWICGPEGQDLIDRTGFVSLKGGSQE